MYTREDVYGSSMLRLLNLVRQNSDRKKVVGRGKRVHVLQHSLNPS